MGDRVFKTSLKISLIHLMRAIAHAHVSTRATGLSRVRNSSRHFCLWHLLSGTLEWRKWNNKITNWIFGHFCSIFVNLSLTWKLYFHVWLQNKGKILIWSGYYNQFGIYQRSRVSLRTTAKQLKESRGIFNIMSNMSNGWKPLTFFVKHSILDAWQGFEYVSVICYTLFGKIENANKIDSVAM